MNRQFWNTLINAGISPNAAYLLAKLEERMSRSEIPADGVTAGAPAVYTATDPAGIAYPESREALSEVTADPLTHWVAGDYLEVADGDKAYWDSSAWIEGISPGFAATGATAGNPGAFTPTGANLPSDLAALIVLDPTADPLTVWAVDEHVVLGDDSHAHWDSTDWVAGDAPA